MSVLALASEPPLNEASFQTLPPGKAIASNSCRRPGCSQIPALVAAVDHSLARRAVSVKVECQAHSGGPVAFRPALAAILADEYIRIVPSHSPIARVRGGSDLAAEIAELKLRRAARQRLLGQAPRPVSM